MSNSAGQAFRDPLFLADATVTYTADEFREAFDILTSPGRRDDLSLRVSQSAAIGMTVDVSPGAAVVPGTSSGAPDAAGLYPQGLYGCRLDTLVSGLVIPTAPSSGSSRVDRIYLQIADKTVVGSGNNEAIIKVQSPSAALPVSSIDLATVNVRVGTTQILNSDITRSGVYCAPASTAIQVAALQNLLKRSPLQGHFWTTPAQWVAPNGALNDIAGSSYAANLIGGHSYLLSSSFTVYRHVAGAGADWIAAIKVNGNSLGSSASAGMVGGLDAQVANISGGAANVAPPIHIQRMFTAPSTGTYTISTALGGANIFNSIGVYVIATPYSECTDLGPMNV